MIFIKNLFLSSYVMALFILEVKVFGVILNKLCTWILLSFHTTVYNITFLPIEMMELIMRVFFPGT